MVNQLVRLVVRGHTSNSAHEHSNKIGALMAEPIERVPKGPLLPRFWHAKHNNGIPYRPGDLDKYGKPQQEDWGTVAAKFGVDVQDLIFFNFMTNNPDEVNWYLHHYVGCVKKSPSGNNWMFSNRANPGIIYIPPADDTTMNFNPEVLCSWVPSNIQEFLMRLKAISNAMSGNAAQRIKRLVGVILRVGYPDCKNLWYYNDMNVTEYVDFKTNDAQHREMTKATGGRYPFDGESGLHAQSGSKERYSGQWQIHPVRDLFDEFACGHWDAQRLADRLNEIDDLMYKGWYQMTLAEAKTTFGGGSAVSTMVVDFIHHVDLLTQDNRNLYYAFG